MAREDTRRTQKINTAKINTEEINDDEEILESRVGRSGQWGDPTDPPVVEVSFEEILELQDELEGEDILGDIIDTAHSDGSTNNVQVAMDQGLVYDPPTDPPVVPSDDLQGAEIAAGFASSIEDEPEVENLPESVDDNDEDIEQDIRRELGYNSETTHLDDVRVYVRDGVAYLRGTVLVEDDISIVEEFVRDLDLVEDIENELEVAG
jgi:translation elongation factor EF-1beta